MSQDNTAGSATPKEVLLSFYQAEASFMQAYEADPSTSFDELRKTLSPNVVLHQSPDLPFGGEYRGHAGYEQWARTMASIFDQLEVKEREFFESGDKVVVLCRFVTRSRINGSIQDFPMTQVVTVKQGRIIDFRPFYWNTPAYIAAAERGAAESDR